MVEAPDPDGMLKELVQYIKNVVCFVGVRYIFYIGVISLGRCSWALRLQQFDAHLHA